LLPRGRVLVLRIKPSPAETEPSPDARPSARAAGGTPGAGPAAHSDPRRNCACAPIHRGGHGFKKILYGFPKEFEAHSRVIAASGCAPVGRIQSLMSRQPQASSRGATYSQPNRDAPRQIVSGARRMQENEHMPARLQMALVAATIIALYSPGVSLAKPRAHLKAHASQAGVTRFDRFERAAARPFARPKVFFVRDRPSAFYRSSVLTGTSPNQTCHYFGGNGLPVQVCW
jgi:hypothetical protein